jgi:hypothetical protein
MRQCQRIEEDMVEKLRDILLTRYIASILIALLCTQALIVLIEKIAGTIFWIINNQRSHSAFEPSHLSFAWDNLTFSAMTSALYLVWHTPWPNGFIPRLQFRHPKVTANNLPTSQNNYDPTDHDGHREKAR